MLWRNPKECPISWQATKRIASPIRLSGSKHCCAAGFTAPVCIVIQFFSIAITLCHQITSASMISPERGSYVDGPIAFDSAEAT